MKYRTGFVTNSSSSSYVCEVCGTVEGGYDLSLSEAYMFECEHGHTVCQDHKLNPSDQEKIDYILSNKEKIAKRKLDYDSTEAEIEEYIKKNIEGKSGEELLKNIFPDDYDDDYDNDYDDVLEIFCPICMLEQITGGTYRKYLEANYQQDMKVLEQEGRGHDIFSKISYVAKKYGIDAADIRNDIKKHYKTLSEIK